MKRILLILLVSLGVVFAKGQTPFTTPNLVTGGNTKITQNKGAGRFDSGLIVAPRFTDTASANLSVVKLYGGMLIRVLDTLWVRNEDATAWNKMGGTTGGGGGGGSQTWQQTLTTGSTLTQNNTIAGGNFDLKFNNTDFYVGNLGGDNEKVVWTDNDGFLYRTTFPILSDSLNPYITGLQNGVISGCTVTWIANYDYEVSPCTYRIAGTVYNIPTSTNITLSAADPTNDRIDVFYVNTSSVAAVVEGTPANPAEEPDIDVSTQLKISFAVVEAATTEPTLAIDDIYKENAGPPTEWTYSDNTANLNPASTNNPYAGSVDIEGTNVASGNQFTMTVGTTPVFTDYVFLNFKIRSKATWAAGRVLAIQFLNGVTPVGNTVVFGQGTYGFQSSITANYQNISIPLGDFGDITGATSVRFIRNGTSTIGFYMDNIILLEARSYVVPYIDQVVGVSPISVNQVGSLAEVSLQTNGISNSYLRQSAGLSVIGNSTNATANVADITAGTDHYVLRRSGTSLGFGTLNAAAMNPTYTNGYTLQTDGSGNLSWSPNPMPSPYQFKVYNVKQYGAVGDGVTDDTQAIQETINDCFANGGGVVFIPNGIYIIDGELQTNVGGINMNCQIYIPYTAANSVGTQKTHIVIWGETPPVFTQSNNPLQTAGQLSTTGVIIKSTLTTYTAKSAVIGTGAPTPTQPYTWGFNYTYLSVYNISIQVANNPTGTGPVIGGISYKYGASLFLDKCLYMTDIQQNLQVEPTNDIAAFETGDRFCETMSCINNTMAFRCRVGFRLGEHTLCNQIQAAGCQYFAELKESAYPVTITQCLSFWNKNDFLVSGTSHLFCLMLSTEFNPSGVGYATYQNSIVDSSNQCRGVVYYNMHNGNTGLTDMAAFKKVGGSFITCSPSDYSFFNVGNPQMNSAIPGTDTRPRLRTQGMVYVENNPADLISNAGFYAVNAHPTMFPYLSSRRAQGTIGAPSATLINDILLRVGGGGYSGAWAATNNAQIDFISQGTHTGSSQPTAIVFYTTPVNSAAIAERMRLDNNGHLNLGTSASVNNALLNIASTTKGVLLPRMTTAQRNAIPTPPEGLEIYNLDSHAKEFFNGTDWKTVITN